MSTENGGCAFPFVDHYVNVETGERFENYGDAGMTLRDYFAAKALSGICSHDDSWGLSNIKKVAEKAYEIADAMIAASGQ